MRKGATGAYRFCVKLGKGGLASCGSRMLQDLVFTRVAWLPKDIRRVVSFPGARSCGLPTPQIPGGEGRQKADFLPYYAERFPVVEVDSTFYRSPSKSMVQGWKDKTPEEFAFALKVPQTITHERVLVD